jgi:hypothetical protein
MADFFKVSIEEQNRRKSKVYEALLGKTIDAYEPVKEQSFQEVIRKWSYDLQRKMVDTLFKNGSVASSNLMQSAGDDDNVSQRLRKDGVTLTINMVDYWEYVEYGRKAGGRPPVQSIYDWIQNKEEIQRKYISNAKDRIGATKSLANAIANKIAKKGVQERPFIRPNLTDNNVRELSERLANYIAETAFQ